jgi:hypothetical protein
MQLGDRGIVMETVVKQSLVVDHLVLDEPHALNILLGMAVDPPRPM